MSRFLFDQCPTAVWMIVAVSLTAAVCGVLLCIHIACSRRAGKALQASEQRLRMALAVAKQGFFDLDCRTGKAWASPEYWTMLGYPSAHSSITTAEWAEKLHPEDRGLACATLSECLAGLRADYRIEYRFKAYSGDWMWILSVGRVVERDPAGQPTRLLGLHTDITERKHREQALEAAQREAERFRLIVETAPQGMGTADLDTRITYLNPALRRALGLKSMEEAHRYRYLDFHTPDAVEFLQQTVIPTVLAEGSWSGELAFRSLDGQLTPTLHHIYLIKNAEGQPTGFANVLTDIAERVRQEQALRESEDRFRSIFELSSDGIALCDPDTGMNRGANPALGRLMGRPPQEIIGTGLDAMHPPEIMPWVEEEFARHIVRGGGTSHNVPIQRPDGSLRYADITSTALTLNTGPVLLATFRDVTERRASEQIIKASEKKYRELYESLMDAYAASDLSGRLIEFNSTYLDVTGYTAEELQAMSYVDLTPERWHEAERRIIEEQVIARGFSEVYEKEYRHKDGHLVPVELRTFLLRDESGRPKGMWAIVRDIGERKRQEETTRRLLQILDTTPDFIGSADPDGRVFYVNAGGRRLLGMTADEDVARTRIPDYHPPEDARFILEEAHAICRRDGFWEGESVFLKRDGTHVPVWQSIFLHTDSSGEVRRISTIARDITERRRIEAALRKNEERLRQAVRVAQVGFFDHDHCADTVYLSPEMRRIYGFEPDADAGLQDIILRMHPDDRNRIEPAIRWAHDPRSDGNFTVEHRLILPDGEIHWLGIRSQTFFEGEGEARRPVRTVGAGLDITERKRAEKALRDSEERLRLALEAGNQGIYDLDISTGNAEVSAEYATMLGYAPEGFRETHQAWLDQLHPDDLERVGATYRSYILGEVPAYSVEFRQRCRSGEWKWILSVGKIVARDEQGNPIRMLGTHTDITERKRIEEEMRKLVAVMENSRDYVGMADLHGQTIYHNPAACRMLGYTGEYPLAIENAHPPEQVDFVKNVALPVVMRDGAWYGENWLRHRDGHLIPVEQSIFLVRDEAGRAFAVATIMRDIIERKRTEQALRDSEERYREAQRTVHMGHWSFDPATGAFLWWSEETFRLIGVDPASGHPSFEGFLARIHEADRPYLNGVLAHVLATGEPVTAEFRVPLPDGGMRILEARSLAHLDTDGTVCQLSGTVLDITQRRASEDALRESEQRFRTVAENAQAIIFILDGQGVFRLSEGLGLATLGLEPGQVVGHSALEMYRDYPNVVDSIREALAGRPQHVVNRLPGATFDTVYTPLYDPLGQVSGVVGIAIDITEREQAKQALEASERFLDAVIEHSPHSLWVSDDKGTMIRMNQACRDLFKVSDEQMIGAYNLFEDNIVERQGLMPLIRTVFEEQRRVHFNLTYDIGELDHPHLASSGRMDLEVTISPVLDHRGRVIHAIVQHVDMTARKRVETALRESEARLSAALESIPFDFFLMGADGRYLLQNSASRKNWGDVTGWRPEDITDNPELLALWNSNNRRAFAGEIVDREECYRVGGEPRYIHNIIAPVATPEGIMSIVGLNIDITEQKRAQEALRASMVQLQTVITQAPIVLFSFDRKGVFTLSEGKGLEGMGLSPGEVVGQSAFDLYRGIPEILSCIDRAVAGESFTTTFELRGRVFEAHHKDFHFENDAGTIGTLVDITERARAEENLRRLNEELESRVENRTRELAGANQQLQQTLETLRATQEDLIRSEKLAGLGSLVAGVAHELNTPLGVSLTAISQFQDKTLALRTSYGNEDLAQEEFESYLANAEKTAEIILHNVDRASGLIRGFKQVAVDQASEALRSIDLKEYLQVVVESLEPELKKGRHRVEIVCPEGIEITTYPGFLAQILSNLMVNSIQHGFGRERTGGQIRIEASCSRDRVNLSYRDDGRGLGADIASRMFEPFFTTARGQGGSGLGLSIVYNLVVHKLKGSVRCESAPGQGMAMLLEFPVHPDSEAKPDPERADTDSAY